MKKFNTFTSVTDRRYVFWIWKKYFYGHNFLFWLTEKMICYELGVKDMKKEMNEYKIVYRGGGGV